MSEASNWQGPLTEKGQDLKADSDTWCRLMGVRVLSPDGWDITSTEFFLESWHEAITRDEFMGRASRSQVQITDMERYTDGW